MFTQDDVEIVAKALPFGALSEINQKTKISRPTIYRFLRGENVRPKSAEVIYLHSLRIIAREKRNKREIKKRRKKVFSIR